MSEQPPPLQRPPVQEKDKNKDGGQGTSGGTVKGTVNEVDLNAIEDANEFDRKLWERYMKLVRHNVAHLSSGEIKNGGFETGRPPMKVIDALKGDPSNAFTRPSLDALQAMQLRPESNSMMTAEELAAISAKMEGLGLPKTKVAPFFWSVARYCADASSSPYADPKGVFEFEGGALTRDAVFAVIKDHCTVRNFCRYYAPVVWNQMLFTKTPPADWQKKNYTEETKYAAFDFFDYVMNPAAIKPLEGLIRKPTPAEIIAHETNKNIAITAGKKNRGFASTSAVVHKGRFEKDPEVNFNTR
ncbi:coat protein [Clivia carlavirus A]|uniref:Capsid protein n=1 Tax=Clivia carlavirus A TaxID=2838077 RepID=A0A8E7NHD4_9VIRU|nr:coat protein [Clivia carlavirus A]QVY19182.1 coat protein [Clivia carlavirus A]